MSRPFGEIMYTLTGLIVAAYNKPADTYGTPVLIDDGQMLVFEPESDTDKIQAYGSYTAGLAVPKGAKVTFKHAGLDTDGLTVVAGAVSYLSGVTPNQVRRSRIAAGGRGMPYFGVIGVGATDDGGVFVSGLPCIKLDTAPKLEFNGETNKFSLNEVSGYAFPYDGNIDYWEQHELSVTWTAPTSGSNFKAWFTALRAVS